MTLAAILALVAAGPWDVATLNPPSICQTCPDPVCIARSAHEVLMIHDAQIESIPEPGGALVWNQATMRVADAALLRRDRAERVGR